MVVHVVARRPDLARLLSYHLGPLGLEVVLHPDPVELLADIESLDPAITLFDVPDFPRHWKPLLSHLRTFRTRAEAVFVLLAHATMDEDEAAKAIHLGVNGIVTDDVTEKRGMERLVDLLRRYEQLQDKRSFVRHLVTDSDRIGLCFIHPRSLSLVTGEVTEASARGLSFVPDQPERCADLPPGTELRLCSLRAGDRIIGVDCRIARGGRELGMEFISFEEGSHGVLAGYLELRSQRALQAAIRAKRVGTPQLSPAGS